MEHAYAHMHLVALNHSQIADWDPCLAAGTDDQRMSPEWPAIKTEGGDATCPTHIIRSDCPDAQPLTTRGPYRPESLLPRAGRRQQTQRTHYVGNAFRRRRQGRCYTIPLVCGAVLLCLPAGPMSVSSTTRLLGHYEVIRRLIPPTDPTHCRTAA